MLIPVIIFSLFSFLILGSWLPWNDCLHANGIRIPLFLPVQIRFSSPPPPRVGAGSWDCGSSKISIQEGLRMLWDRGGSERLGGLS